jgi:sialate O-acetylesterase
MSLRRAVLGLAVLACLLVGTSATLQLPAVISSHMVLQRDTGATIWGWTDHAGASITVNWNDAKVGVAIADKTGRWQFDFGKVPASQDNTIVLSDSDSSITLKDVSFGDVVLCSGQSNMAMSVAVSNNASAEIADSINYPQLRMFALSLTASYTPLTNMTSLNPAFNWTVSSPAAFQTGAWGTFSATCYFTGRDLYRALGGKIPVGLVGSDWGGTRVEAWSSPDALKKCPGKFAHYEPFGEQPVRRQQLQKVDMPGQNNASVLFNAMIHPLLPMRFKLALWYRQFSLSANPLASLLLLVLSVLLPCTLCVYMCVQRARRTPRTPPTMRAASLR